MAGRSDRRRTTSPSTPTPWRGARRPRQALGDAQRAVLLEPLRLRHRDHGAGSGSRSRRASPPPTISCSATGWRSSGCAPASPTASSASSSTSDRNIRRPPTSADVAAASVKDALFNRWFVEPIAGLGYPIDATGDVRWSAAEIHDGDLDIIATPIDVLGVNYYTRSLIDAGGEQRRRRQPGDGDGLGDLSRGPRRDAALAARPLPLPALPHHRERGGDGRPSRRHRVRRRPGSHRLHPPSPRGRPRSSSPRGSRSAATSHGA